MGLYGDILRATDGSIFTFDKIYSIEIQFFDKWIEEFSKILEMDEQALISDAYGTIVDASERYTLQNAADYARYLSQAQVSAIVKGLANTDDVFVGRYMFVEGICQVYTKIYNNNEKKYNYVKVADLNTLNLLNEANTDEWINIEQNSSEIGDIQLVHADPAPPVEPYNGYDTVYDDIFENDYIYPIDEDGQPNEAYFLEPGQTQTTPAKVGWQERGILHQYNDGKGHQIKKSYTYEKKAYQVRSIDYFDNQIYYVGWYGEETSKKLYTQNTTNEKIKGYIKLTHWNRRSDTYKGLLNEGINSTSYVEDYIYYIVTLSRSEQDEDVEFTHAVTEREDYTLILNGGGFLGKYLT